jgi:hypothetical protein
VFNINGWNVAATNKMPCPEDTEIFANKKMREG